MVLFFKTGTLIILEIKIYIYKAITGKLFNDMEDLIHHIFPESFFSSPISPQPKNLLRVPYSVWYIKLKTYYMSFGDYK